MVYGKMLKLIRGQEQKAHNSKSPVPQYLFGINSGLLNMNVILPLLIICLLVLSAILVSGCSKSESAEEKDKKSTTSLDEDSKDADDENQADETNGEEQTAPSDSSSQSQSELVKKTALNYAKQMNSTLPDLNVVNMKIIGQWACVDVEPVDRSADKARVLLKNSAGQWEVVAFGYVLPEDYPDAPAELFE